MNPLLVELRESFFDKIYDSQKIFISLMRTMSFPGLLYQLPSIQLNYPDKKMHYLLSVILTLCDLETSYMVITDQAQELIDLNNYINLNTSCNEKDLKSSDFIIVLKTGLFEQFLHINHGTLAEPNKSATLFYLVENLSNEVMGNGQSIILQGPGIKEEQLVFFDATPQQEIEYWKESRKNYPLGVDIYLIDKNGLICGIPRSVKIV